MTEKVLKLTCADHLGGDLSFRILGFLKININSTLDHYKVFRWRIIPHQDLKSTWIGPAVFVLGLRWSRFDWFWFDPSV